METADPFALFDCSLAKYATGRSCANLRELLEAVRTASDATIEHHMMRCALDDHFDLYEFPNDLARWCWDGLDDDVLAEQLGLIDPYQYQGIDALRSALANAIEERLWGVDRVAWCRPGLELHLIESRLMVYDTGDRLPTPGALAEALPRVSLRSLFYHVHEARRRSGNRTDDFSDWLQKYGADERLVSKIRGIDFYFLNLNQLRNELVSAFEQAQSEPQPVAAATA